MFEITFACKGKLTGKQLKQTIDDYHFLTPGITKWIKSKVPNEAPEENEVSNELYDHLDWFKIELPVYKAFDNIEHKGKIIGYDSKYWLYDVQYVDGDKEGLQQWNSCTSRSGKVIKYNYWNKIKIKR